MKYIVLLVDGMADEPIEALGNKTPLEVAAIPTIHQLARKGRVGLVKTVPDGMAPGSDVANLSVMGYEPLTDHTGRSPLEAASIGVSLSDTDVTFRVNFVTLTGDGAYEDMTIIDHSAGEISTDEAEELLGAVRDSFATPECQFFLGTSYRHLLLWDNGQVHFKLTPPHDILGQTIADYLPNDLGSEFILHMMKASVEILKDHPVNVRRVAKGLNPANGIWIWGAGKKPHLKSFYEKFEIRGNVISAVDLIKGIGILAGLKSLQVEGATGNIHTNFLGKGQAALSALLSGDDFTYIHIEAPDECGHQGDLPGKIKSVELIDQQVLKPLLDGLEGAGEDYRILILPDHPTPIRLRTHTSEPVPFVLFDSRREQDNKDHAFTEKSAAASGVMVASGKEMMVMLLSDH